MNETGTGAGWESWFQGVAGKVIGAAADAKYSQPYEIDKLRIQALGDMGYYNEGQAGTIRQAGTVAGIPTGTLLLIGGIALVFVLMKD
jgi:hypothetical protein